MKFNDVVMIFPTVTAGLFQNTEIHSISGRFSQNCYGKNPKVQDARNNSRRIKTRILNKRDSLTNTRILIALSIYIEDWMQITS